MPFGIDNIVYPGTHIAHPAVFIQVHITVTHQRQFIAFFSLADWASMNSSTGMVT